MYAKVENEQATEYTFRDLRVDYPNVSFPRVPPLGVLAEYGIYPVTLTDRPTIDPAVERVSGYSVSWDGANAVQVWAVEPLSAEEQAAYQQEQGFSKDVEALRADPQVGALLKARPSQINDYIDANVTDLDSAKTILKIYGRALAVLAYSVVD